MVRMKLGWFAVFVLLSATLAGPSLARPKKRAEVAAQVPSEAQQRFQRALDLYDEGNLDAARAELQRAYDIAPHYRLLYNLGQVAFELHDYPAALSAFERYLSEGGSKVPEPRRAQIESDIEKLKGRVARIVLRVDVSQADVFLDDVAVGATPLAAPLVVAAGRRKVAVAKEGYATITRWIEVAGGDSSELTMALDQAPERSAAASASSLPSPAAIERQFGLSAPADAPGASGVLWGGWAVAGSLAVAAGVTGSFAYVASRDLRDERDQLGVTRSELDRKSAQVRNLSLATDIMGGASIVTAAATLIATLSRSSGAGTTGSLAVVPAIGRVEIRGEF